MNFLTEKIKYKHVVEHKTKSTVLLKFILVFILFFAYFLFISWRYGINDGFLVTFLTWSTFVLCTPIAEAGLLIDLPMRLLFRVRMIFSEILVWIIAITLNASVLIFNPGAYDKTELLILFRHILENPIPFWLLIIISGIGTFISIRFGDELLDTVNHHERTIFQKHRKKHAMIIMIFLMIVAIILYYYLLNQIGINI